MTWTLIFLLEVHKLATVEYQRLMEYRERPMVVQEETAQPMEKTTLENPLLSLPWQKMQKGLIP